MRPHILRHMAEGVERYFVVPHTHWDREWYRPLEHFRLMLGATVDAVLDTLERDAGFPSFTLDGQAIVLEDYLEVRPENATRLRELIAAGRIEIGPSYMLPDEFLVGAEPLVRNLLIGRAVCERWGGRPSPAGYLPDSFGHPLQLPQILAGFGLQSMLFSRGLGDELDELGVVFNWAAPDGSAVLAIQLLPDYGNFAGIDGVDDAEARVRGLLNRFGPALARGGVRDVVLCNGSDHLPVQPEMPEVCAELERRFPGSTFAIARFEDYVSSLRTGEVPTWTGELLGSRLLNVLRGVNSARLYLKQANERAEQRLLAVETLSALCVLRSGTRFPHDDFDFAWRELLKCHPHDSICGCSCDEVHRDMLVRYASLDRTLDVLSANALRGLASSERPSAVGVVNALPYTRSVVVQAPGRGPTLVELGGFEARTVELEPGDSSEPRTGDRIENDRFRVQGAPDGTVTITDLRTGRRFAGLHALEDEADVGDLYNFCPLPGGAVRRCAGAAMRVLSEGPVRWELEIAYAGDLPRGVDAAAAAARRDGAVRGDDRRAPAPRQRPDRVRDHGRQRRRGPPAEGRVPGRRRSRTRPCGRTLRGRAPAAGRHRAPHGVARAAGPHAARHRGSCARLARAHDSRPARVRGARGRPRVRAVPDDVALRRLDLARDGRDRNPPHDRRTPDGDARGAMPGTACARVRARVRRRPAQRRCAAARLPGLPLAAADRSQRARTSQRRSRSTATSSSPASRAPRTGTG